MIRRLSVRGYKSLRDCSVEFSRVSVILGPNGAGKSNLLDLIALLSRLATRETVNEAFLGHRGRPLEAFHSPRGFGPQAYEALLKEEALSFRVECDLELHPRIVEDVNRTLEERERIVEVELPYTRVSERLLRYTLEISLHPRSGELFVADESLRALRTDLEPKAESTRRAFIERTSHDGRERFVARIERQAHPRYFEPGRVRTFLSELSDPVYHPHVVAAAREIASWRGYYVEPDRIRQEVSLQSAEDPGPSGEMLAPYLYYLQDRYPATLRSLGRTLSGIVPGIAGLRVDAVKGMLEVVCTSPDGAEWPTRLLSEGTLRLLCILGISVAPTPPAVVIYEEPENGVNPARLDWIARVVQDAVAGRDQGMQFILTTHSASLCSLLPEHLVVCRWGAGRGSWFERLDLDPDTLYFEQSVRELLDHPAPKREA